MLKISPFGGGASDFCRHQVKNSRTMSTPRALSRSKRERGKGIWRMETNPLLFLCPCVSHRRPREKGNKCRQVRERERDRGVLLLLLLLGVQFHLLPPISLRKGAKVRQMTHRHTIQMRLWNLYVNIWWWPGQFENSYQLFDVFDLCVTQCRF